MAPNTRGAGMTSQATQLWAHGEADGTVAASPCRHQLNAGPAGTPHQSGSRVVPNSEAGHHLVVNPPLTLS